MSTNTYKHLNIPSSGMPPYTLDHPFGAHSIHSRLDHALRNVRTNGYSFIGSMSPIMATMPAASTPARPLAAACPPNSLQQYSANDTDKRYPSYLNRAKPDNHPT